MTGNTEATVQDLEADIAFHTSSHAADLARLSESSKSNTFVPPGNSWPKAPRISEWKHRLVYLPAALIGFWSLAPVIWLFISSVSPFTDLLLETAGVHPGCHARQLPAHLHRGDSRRYRWGSAGRGARSAGALEQFCGGLINDDRRSGDRITGGLCLFPLQPCQVPRPNLDRDDDDAHDSRIWRSWCHGSFCSAGQDSPTPKWV